jgi:hypothetical protein
MTGQHPGVTNQQALKLVGSLAFLLLLLSALLPVFG